jgi:hypothetical protein
MKDMHLVQIFLGAHLKAKHHGDQGDDIHECQFPEIPFETDNEGHYQEIREIEQVFACP